MKIKQSHQNIYNSFIYFLNIYTFLNAQNLKTCLYVTALKFGIMQFQNAFSFQSVNLILTAAMGSFKGKQIETNVIIALYRVLMVLCGWNLRLEFSCSCVVFQSRLLCLLLILIEFSLIYICVIEEFYRLFCALVIRTVRRKIGCFFFRCFGNVS